MFIIYDNKKNYISESFYFGEFNDEGIINGVGIKIIKTNNIYKGEFYNGEYHRKGLLIKNMQQVPRGAGPCFLLISWSDGNPSRCAQSQCAPPAHRHTVYRR